MHYLSEPQISLAKRSWNQAIIQLHYIEDNISPLPETMNQNELKLLKKLRKNQHTVITYWKKLYYQYVSLRNNEIYGKEVKYRGNFRYSSVHRTERK